MEEKYQMASIRLLQELYEREETESQKLQRKREISRSSDYDKGIAFHERRKQVIRYLLNLAQCPDCG